MPNYDFACDVHGGFEAVVSLADYDRMMDLGGVPCPECGSTAVKQASAPGFALKGQGFHKNDYHAYGPRRK